MFGRALLGAVALLAGTAVVASAGPKEDLQAAAKKLADGGNYSWKTTTESAAQGGFTPGPTEGKTQKDGLTMTTTSFNDMTSITVRMGDKGAVKRGDQDWMSLAEIQAAGRGRGFGGFGGGGGGVAPAAQAQQYVDRLADIKKDGDAYTATVTGDGVSAFTQFGRGGRRGGGGAGGAAGGQGPQITNGKVALKFWVKDGAISKYEMNIQGNMSFNGNDIDISRTTTTEIKDVGTTKVEIPAEAKAKLAE